MHFPGILPGMMTSDDISNVALRHAQIMEQSRVFTGAIGSGMTAPAPSPDQIPALVGPSAGMMAAGAATGAAHLGVAGLGAVGMAAGFGAFGGLSKPLSMLDPMSGVFSAATTGFGLGGGARAMAGGSIAPLARGLAAGSLAMGGYMAAGSMFNAMTEQVMRGAQEQMMAQQMLMQNVTAQNMSGMSFQHGQLGHMSTALRQMAGSSTMPFGGVMSMAQAGLQSGMYQDITSTGQFANRTRELMRTSQAMSAVYGLSRPEESFQLAAQAQQMGFYGPGSMNAALGIGAAGMSAGIGGMAMMNAGTAGAGVAGGFGLSRQQGATVAMGLASRLAGGYRGGSIDQSRMRDMMGGASLEEGVSGLAANLTQGAYAAAFDTTTLMGLVDPDTGHIDEGMAAAFAGGMMSRKDLSRSASRNRRDRGARMAVQARRGGLASELMSMTSPEELMAGMAMSEINSRGIRSGESADDVVGIALQKFGNMGEQQAETIRELIRSGPSLKADISSKMQEHIRSAQAAAPNMGFLDAIKKKLVDRYVEPWAAPLRDLGASIASWGEELAESASTALLGRRAAAMGPASAGGRYLASRIRNGDDASFMRGAGTTARGGMNVMGQDWVFNNDPSNFGGTVGLVDSVGVSPLLAAGVTTGAVGSWLGANALVAGGDALMASAGSSLQYGRAALTGSAPLTGGMTARLGVAGRSLLGGAARGVAGGVLSLAGSAARMLFNRATTALSVGAMAGDVGSYLGSVDNRGTVPVAFADDIARLGLGEEISGQAPGYLPVEQEELGWAGGWGHVLSNSTSLIGSTYFGGYNDDPVARRSTSAEGVARVSRILEARMSPMKTLSDTFDSAKIMGFRKLVGERRADLQRVQYRSGKITDMVSALGAEGLKYLGGRELHEQGALLEAASPGLLQLKGVTDSLSLSGEMQTKTGQMSAIQSIYTSTFDESERPKAPKAIFNTESDGTLWGDMKARAGMAAAMEKTMLSSKDLTTVHDELSNLVAGNDQASIDDLLEFMRAPKATDGDDQRRSDKILGRIVERYPDMSDPLKRMLQAADAKGREQLRGTIGAIMTPQVLRAQRERADMVAQDRKHLMSFASGGVEGNAMSAAIGDVGHRAILSAADADLADGSTSSKEALVKEALELGVRERGYAMQMLNEEQQYAVARGSQVYEGMTNKRRNLGQNLLTGLMNLEGADFVMDKDFTTGVMKRVNSGKGLVQEDWAEIDRLLKISKFDPAKMEQAKSQLSIVASKTATADQRAAAAAEFSGIAATSGGKIGGGGGGGGAGGDMTANIAAFNAAIKNAASVISNAAQGKNQSGPAS